MKKIKNWVINRFLPVWAREELMRENERLHRENDKLTALLKERDAYIDGLEAGIRSQRRIVINAGEVRK